MRQLAALALLALLACLAWPGTSHAGHARGPVGETSLFFNFGVIEPYDNDFVEIDTAPRFSFGFLYRSNFRWSAGARFEYLGWDGTAPPVPGLVSVSDVWRTTGNMSFDLVRGPFSPFVLFDAGAAHYHFADFAYSYGYPGTFYREGYAVTPTFGAGLGIGAREGPVRFSVSGEWITFWDDLPNSFSLMGGVEFSLTPPPPPPPPPPRRRH